MNLLTVLMTETSGVPDSGLAGFVADIMGSVGLVGVGLILAVETILPFLPSEVALPLAGFSANRGDFGLVPVIISATVGSVAGALVLYWISLKFGLERTRTVLAKVPFVTEHDIDKGVAWFARNDALAVFSAAWCRASAASSRSRPASRRWRSAASCSTRRPAA
ncbi:MAG: hypothetical protein ABW004_00505 [Aeromicrobium sp.]